MPARDAPMTRNGSFVVTQRWGESLTERDDFDSSIDTWRNCDGEPHIAWSWRHYSGLDWGGDVDFESHIERNVVLSNWNSIYYRVWHEKYPRFYSDPIPARVHFIFK